MNRLAGVSATALLVAVVSGALVSCSKADADGSQKASSSSSELAALLKAEEERENHPAVCSLINAEEMSRILGGAVSQRRPDRASTCTYTPASGTGAVPYTEITIDWNGGAAAMTGVKLAERLIGRDAGMSISTTIGGVGDEATMLIGNVMTVRQAQTVISIDLRLQPNAKEKGVTIARTIIERAHLGEASK